MNKTYLAQWFGLSLVLHGSAIMGLYYLASHSPEQTQQSIMVIIDNLDQTQPPHQTFTRTPERSAPRPSRLATPAGPEPAALTSEPVQPTLQPVPVRISVAIQPSEQSQVKEAPIISPKHTSAGSVRPSPAGSSPLPVQQAVVDGGTSPEKVQQRYVKEHFTFIRELISKHLVYPSLARKMNWSGKVVLAFAIAEDGTVHAIRVLETSGYPLLDKSALETVRNAAPFPRPPIRTEIVAPINFSLMQ